jgi:FkbH-like protein
MPPLLKLNRSDLNYRELVRKARHLKVESGQKLRLALLADVSTQHIVPLLRVLFAANGIDADIYEAGFDTIHLEAYNPESALYGFAPQIIVILQSIVKLRARYHESGERDTFPRAQADDIENVWRTLQSRLAVPIIQTNFAVPFERAYGNFGAKVAGDLQGTVNEVNREVALRAREHASVFICDIEQISSWIGRRQFFDERLWALAKSLCSLEAMPEVAQNIVDIALATIGRAVKCVVLDLDNTLWGGVVGDDGLEGIGLGDLDDGGAFRSLQLFMRELWRRGILLAVCSKNNEEIARRVFREHPDMVLREEHIAVFVANWDDKASNIAKIREKLNIGYDAMVFLDDNPFERNLVRQLIPQIIVPELPEDPGLYVRAVSELNLFESAGRSELDAQRTEMYQTQEKRSAEMQRFTDVKEYLRSLDSKIHMRPFEARDLGRIAQLIQRSNQFNLTTRRYSEAQCEAMMSDPQLLTYSVNVRDRFGDFGLIAVGVLRKCPGYLEIDTFLMSCRVLQRGVEQYAMNRIFEYAREGKFERVVGRYIPTAKNVMVEGFYRQFGFEQSSTATGEGVEWSLETRRYVPQEVFVTDATPAATQGAQ